MSIPENPDASSRACWDSSDDLRILRDCLTSALQQSLSAERIAQALVEAIQRGMPGQVYIPKRTAVALKRRNAALIADYRNGAQVKSLAKKYALRVRQVYAIVRRNR